MSRARIVVVGILIVLFSVSQISCMKQPDPGRIVDASDWGVVLTLTPGWEGEVDDLDWLAYKRNRKGREDFSYVFPPITARDIPIAEAEKNNRHTRWRFKGVEGSFDKDISPMAGDYETRNPGLWTMLPEQLSLIGSWNVTLDFPSLNGIQATARLYEHTLGRGDVSAVWRSYVVTFNHGPNAYEFAILIPSDQDDQVYIDRFWASIQDVSINLNP